jgi:acyl transferase domain-containing protein
LHRIVLIDPQQRQLLECTYEALENAGLTREYVAGRQMGVFIGGNSSDYRMGTLRDLDSIPMFDATGNHQSIQAGRISYYFNLRGPCFAVDTACSSSLHALHLAVQSIRSGESDSAVVAGCSLHLQPDDFVSMSMLGYDDPSPAMLLTLGTVCKLTRMAFTEYSTSMVKHFRSTTEQSRVSRAAKEPAH